MTSSSKRIALAHERAAKLFGLSLESLSKSDARKQFLPLIREMERKQMAVEVTERERASAVMISMSLYEAMVNKLWELLGPPATQDSGLMGSITVVGNLEQASKRAAANFKESISRGAKKL